MKPNDLEQNKQLGQSFQLFFGLMMLAAGAISTLFISYLIFLMINQQPNPALIQTPSKPYGGGAYVSAAANPYPNLWKDLPFNLSPKGSAEI